MNRGRLRSTRERARRRESKDARRARAIKIDARNARRSESKRARRARAIKIDARERKQARQAVCYPHTTRSLRTARRLFSVSSTRPEAAQRDARRGATCPRPRARSPRARVARSRARTARYRPPRRRRTKPSWALRFTRDSRRGRNCLAAPRPRTAATRTPASRRSTRRCPERCPCSTPARWRSRSSSGSRSRGRCS